MSQDEGVGRASAPSSLRSRREKLAHQGFVAYQRSTCLLGGSMDMQPQAVAGTESTFPRHAAKAAWVAPILAAVASNFIRGVSPFGADMVALALIVVGLAQIGRAHVELQSPDHLVC